MKYICIYEFYHNRQYNVYKRLINIINDKAIIVAKYIYNIVYCDIYFMPF